MDSHTCQDCSLNCLACESATKCTECAYKFNLDFEEKCIQCPAELDQFFDKFRDKKCKPCEELEAEDFLKEISKNGKLAEVKIENIPDKPYQTSYPFTIEYESPDSRFMCIKFQLR